MYKDEEGAAIDEDVWGGKVKKIEQNINGFRSDVNEFMKEVRSDLIDSHGKQVAEIKNDIHELKLIVNKIVDKQRDMAEEI